MPAKRTCAICHQPVTMKEPVTLWFHTNLEAGTTHVWHMTCKMEQAKGGEAMNHADGIHTIPVPHGWTVEQAWEHIKRGDQLPNDGEPTWANVLIKNNRLAIHAPSTQEGGAR